MQRAILLLSFSLLPFLIFAQTTKILGKVVDEKGLPMPYVNVYIKGSTQGTTSNFEGDFSLETQGFSPSQLVVFKFVGYREKSVAISEFASGPKTIELKPQEVSLSEVVISAKGKDPAYYIMKKASENRKKHEQPLDTYQAKLYMKGRAFFMEAPDSLNFLIKLSMGEEEKAEVDEQVGKVVYLTESYSKISYQAPNKIKEELLASRQSGTSPGFSPNRSIFLENNFYQSLINQVNERGLISPLSPNATLYYDFKLLGKFEENGFTINRIQVKPKRKVDPVFEGEIFIVHDRWNIHSLNLSVNDDAIDNGLLDSVTYKQSYQILPNDVWMPLSLQSSYYLKFLGFKLNYTIAGQYSDYEVETNYKKDFFGAEVYRVNDSVAKNDSVLMNALRPVVLDSMEQKHYFSSDSTAAVQNNPAYRDSIRRRSNEFKIGDFFTGYRYNYANNNYLDVSGLLGAINYTAVDGLVLQPTIRYSIRDSNNIESDRIELNPRYAFNRKNFDAYARWTHRLNRKKQSGWYLDIGRYTQQINQNNPISGFLNAYYTYFRERNYAQFMSENFLQAGYFQELFNGLSARFWVRYADRFNLQNLDNPPIYKDFESREFSENIQAATTGKQLEFGAKLRYRINQKYAEYPEYRLRYPDERYPTLLTEIAYAPEDISRSSYLRLEFGLEHQLDLKLFGDFSYSGFVGFFPFSESLSFFDFKHFAGNQIPFINNRQRAFQALPYYNFSTGKDYIELHAEHHFNGFLFNKIPLLNKWLNWQFYAGANFLSTAANPDYYEAYVGLENIFSVFSVQVAAPYSNKRFASPIFMVGSSIIIN